MKNKKHENNFKNTLKFLRLQNKLTQKSLGAAIGYGYTAISNYESGRNEPSINDLIKLADYFHVSVDFLIGHESKINEEAKYCLIIKSIKAKEIMSETMEKLNNVFDS